MRWPNTQCVLSSTTCSLSRIYCAVMMEGVGREVAEDTVCEAVLFAHQEVRYIELCVSILSGNTVIPCVVLCAVVTSWFYSIVYVL